MKTEALRESIKDYGRDVRLNLSSVLAEEGAPGLTLQQIWSVALASAYFTKKTALIEAIDHDSRQFLSPEHIEAAKAATVIMAMNNVYYKAVHFLEDKEISKMPAKLRMNVIGKPGIDKPTFELMCTAVSALSGCAVCVNSHVQELKKTGLTNEAIQSAIRIAAVINSAAQALTIG